MASQTLLEIVQRRYGTAVDPDSDGGQVLQCLVPRGNFGDDTLRGTADTSPLSFSPTASGVSVRAAKGNEALVLSLPIEGVEFVIVPPGPARPVAEVEIVLISPKAPVPFLRPAALNADGMLQAAAGGVVLEFPKLLLVVTASATPPASARLAP